ncbi:MAG: sulfatase [Porphyromonadaceae bacterium]|nr:sulfatase [Porphyromonadaceae bacterium]
MNNKVKPIASLLGGLALSPLAYGQKPLNIVYIMSDDHAEQMISCYDKRYIQTPHIDALAAEGVRFTQSFVANSLSGPSRACMLTGKHSHLNGKKNNEHHQQFDQNQQTMPKLLQQGGYQTALIGKLHLEGIPQGFDHWEMLPGQGDYYDPHFVRPTSGGGTDTVQYQGYVTNIITDLSLNWLEQRDRSKPFAIFIHHKAAHRNWMPDEPDIHKYEERTFPLPDTFYDRYEGRKAAALQEMSISKDMTLVYDLKMMNGSDAPGLDKWYSYDDDTQGIHGVLRPETKAKIDSLYGPLAREFYAQKPEGKQLDEWKFNRYMRDYAKVVASLDRNIGRVVDYLREHDLLDNTLIVYTSDQGFYMGEHGWFDKRFMYEESMRTPLVMRLPSNLKRRGEVKELVQNIDYAPTFLDLAGVPIPEDIQGVSLAPLLREKKSPRWERKSLYYHFYEYPGEHAVRRHYGVRDKRYKLIHFYGDINEWELYDLKKDPKELHNLYNDTRYKGVQARMHRELERLRKHYKAENAY